MNLVKNALKFTNANGKITIRCKYNAETYLLTVSVTDTGIGIQPDDMDRLFKNFSKIKASQHLNVEGIGLGLTISKTLVEKNAGQIFVKSKGKD